MRVSSGAFMAAFAVCILHANGFTAPATRAVHAMGIGAAGHASPARSGTALGVFDFIKRLTGEDDEVINVDDATGVPSSIPKSPNDRDSQAIRSIQAAIADPKTPSYPLIECEFPPLEALNKLGDGSLRSANMVDDANLAFCKKLAQALSPMASLKGPQVRVLISGSASSSLLDKAGKQLRSASVTSLRNGIPEDVNDKDVCILLAPSSRKDYLAAQQLASDGKVVVLINGFAKDQKSVSSRATFGYFLKPLTYNSQVVGYLVRTYPNDWSVVDVVSKETLKMTGDSQILYRNTNTPDLREPGKLIQKSVDERAIQARKNSNR